MIGGQGTVGSGQCGSSEIRKLFGVEFHWNAQCLRLVKDTSHLFRRKSNALAKTIHCVRESFGMSGGQAFPADKGDVLVYFSSVFWRNRVGTEKAGLHAHLACFAQLAGYAQHFELGFHIETVAGLDLDGTHALGQQRLQSWQGLGKQLILRGVAGCRHCAEDAATASGDFLVARTLQPQLELCGAAATINQMRVAVHQRGCDQSASQVPASGPGIAFRKFTLGANPRDFPLGHDHGPALDQAIGRASRNHRGQLCIS